MNITSANRLLAAHRVPRIQAFTFACVAGYVDAHGLLRFHVYASFMSGNTTRAGVNFAAGQTSESALNLLAVVSFVLGAFLGSVLLHSRERFADFATIVMALALLILDIAGGIVRTSPWLSVALLSTAMGAMNCTITQIGGQPINIGYVSGGLNKLAEHLALAHHHVRVENPEGPEDTHFRRAALIAEVWGMFLCGAFAGALVERLAPAVGMWLPVAALLGVLAGRVGWSAPPAGESPLQ